MLPTLYAIIYTLLYAAIGISISFFLFSHFSIIRKIWLGLTFGLFGMTWMPSLISFLTGKFSIASHILGIVLFIILFLACILIQKKKAYRVYARIDNKSEWIWLLTLIPIIIIGLFLFSTHILQKKTDGLYVGQTTYGDLAMHLGFISSIAVQGVFPPQYSIFPGHTINYPFLCEISASSLHLMGADLRTSYLISAIYAFLLVVFGAFALFKTWLKKPGGAVLATYLFFIGGGFGFAYFLDQANGSSTVASLLNSSFKTNISQLLEGYYTTPTNLPDLGLRWVNPIVDMLIPQRATLFGWAFLFPCLTLLHEYSFNDDRRIVVPLGILAGGLPLIHTHSFLALGVISAVYCISDLACSFNRYRLRNWLIYGGLAIALALPQLVNFTFAQVSESSMVQFSLNWANDKDSWFWFYLKNWGMLFLMLLPGMLLLSKQDRRIMSGPLVLWALSEVIIFQPNTYDNNKLIFVFFMYLCGLCAKLVCEYAFKLKAYLQEKQLHHRTISRTIFAVAILLFVFTFLPYISSALSNSHYIKQGNLITILFLCLLLVYLAVLDFVLTVKYSFSTFDILIAATGLITIILICILFVQHANSVNIYISRLNGSALFISDILIIVFATASAFGAKKEQPFSKNMLSYACFRISEFLLICSLFLSGIMTIARECRSSYQVFNINDVQAAEYIKSNCPPDAVFLTSNNWHLNAVSVLTGRSIVCGPDLFLYFHGIDTTERKTDIVHMYNDPDSAEDLYKKYDVSYVFIGPDERNSFVIDTDYFNTHFSKIYDSGGIIIYKTEYEPEK